jgi:hypothetical protein
VDLAARSIVFRNLGSGSSKDRPEKAPCEFRIGRRGIIIGKREGRSKSFGMRAMMMDLAGWGLTGGNALGPVIALLLK